jgi:4-hydroxy-tetrahydrodipicolinate synthase
MTYNVGNPMFKGSLVALITPFINETIDEKAFRKLVSWQIDEGTDGLIPVGTTGESPTLSHDEHKRVIELCVDEANGRVPIIAGAGSNSTAEAIEFTAHAKSAGATAALHVTPYYNKPTQEGMYQHFIAIADAVDLPVIIYNIPPRSVVDMTISTMKRLAEHPNIVGVKDATQDLVRPLATRLEIGPDFCQLSGEDATIVPYLSQGGHGCISVTCNVAPGPLSELHKAWQAGDLNKTREINDRLLPLHDALFCETSPGPVKYAAHLLGICSPDARLPIWKIADETKERVKKAMRHAGLLN